MRVVPRLHAGPEKMSRPRGTSFRAGHHCPLISLDLAISARLLPCDAQLSQLVQVIAGVAMGEQLEGVRSRWQTAVAAMGFTDFISPEDGFRTLDGSFWPGSNSSGIYCWIAENGEAYVGQAVSVRRRLLDHWKVHRDMVAAAFMKLDPEKLDEVERDCVNDISNLFATRNIKHALSTSSFVPFDAFVTEAERHAFLCGSSPTWDLRWRDLQILEPKQGAKFRCMRQERRFKEILDALKIFISNCIPNPAFTENRFWSVTLYPQPLTKLRVNAGQQEVFTVLEGNGEDSLFARPLAKKRLNVKEYMEGPGYKTQSFAYFIEIDDLDRWFTTEHIVAVRELVVWLMRHTTSLNNGSHCPQVIRAAFRESKDLPGPV